MEGAGAMQGRRMPEAGAMPGRTEAGAEAEAEDAGAMLPEAGVMPGRNAWA